MSKLLDYTGLQYYHGKVEGEISQLRQEVSGGTANYTPLKNLDKNAAETADNVSLISDFAPCASGDTIIWHHGYTSAQTAKCLCFYNSSKAYISGQYYTANTANERTFTPSNASIAYVRASFSSNSNQAFLKVNGTTVWERKDGTIGLEDEVDAKAASSSVDAISNGTERNYYIGKFDRSSSSTSISFAIANVAFGVTPKIQCSPGDLLQWNAHRTSGSADVGYYLVFYDSSNAQAGYYTATAGSLERRVSVPSNSTYLIMGFLRGHNSYLKLNGVTVWQETEPSTPADSNEDVIYGEGKYIYWNAEYLSVNYGTATVSTINSRTGYIDISDYSVIKTIMPRVSTRSDAGLCFYQSDGTFIYGVFPNANASYVAQQDYEWREIEVPSNAKYMATTIFNTIRDHWALKGIKKAFTSVEKSASLRAMENSLVDRIVVGAPQLYLSNNVSDTEVSLNSKTVAELYAEYDALVTAYPELISREPDLGTVTKNSTSYTIRAYTLGYNKQITIDHEPAYNEVFDDSDNNWNLGTPRKILIVSGLHGDEKTPTWGLMLAIKDILDSDTPWANYIKANAIFKIIPCLNPSGWETCTRADSAGNVINTLAALNDPEVNAYLSWIGNNSDAFVLLDFHGTQGRYAYMPVIDRYPFTNTVLRLANQLAPAFNKNWKTFYNSIVDGYGTTYSPFLVGKSTAPATYIGTGWLPYEMLISYGVHGFTIETPDNLPSGAIATNDLRNCKLTKDLAINTMQYFIDLPYIPDVYY